MSADGDRRAARQHLAGRAAGERRLLAREQLGRLALHGAHHEAVALDEAQRAGVGVQEQRGLRDDLAQHGRPRRGWRPSGRRCAAAPGRGRGRGARTRASRRARWRRRRRCRGGARGRGRRRSRHAPRGQTTPSTAARPARADDGDAERRALARLEQRGAARRRTRGGRTSASVQSTIRPSRAASCSSAPAWPASSTSAGMLGAEPLARSPSDSVTTTAADGPQRAAGGGRRPRCRSRRARACPPAPR